MTMNEREFKELPIRTIPNTFNDIVLGRFDIGFLCSNEPRGSSAEAHRHDFYHILYIKRGNGVHEVDFKAYEVRSNSMFFISPGQVHALSTNGEAKIYTLSFDANFFRLNNTTKRIEDFPFFHTITNSPALYLDERDGRMSNIFEQLLSEYQSKERWNESVLRSLLDILLVYSLRNYGSGDAVDSISPLTLQVRKLEALIDNYFREYKLLDDYAKMMHLSPKQLTSICRKGFDKSVTTLIHERIIIEAKRLLLFTDNTVSQISDDLGFSDKSYFMRFFKKQTSQTADGFRKINKI